MTIFLDEAPAVRPVPDRTSPVGLGSYISGNTLISGDGPAWRDVFVQVLSRNCVQRPFLVPAVAEPLLVWVVSGSAVVEERELGSEWTANRVEVGDFFLTRSPTPYEMRWRAEGDEPFRVVHLYVSVPLFERAVGSVLGRLADSVTLKDVSGGRDVTVSCILGLLHEEAAAEAPSNALYIEGLAQSLAVHLVRHYAVVDTQMRVQNALPGVKLGRVIAYMEDRLEEAFDLGRLAQAVGISAFHFSRLFKKATGLPPSHYFIRQRVSKAKRLLQETDMSIIEIGLMVGCSSPSHFAQIFRRETGLSPSDYRRG